MLIFFGVNSGIGMTVFKRNEVGVGSALRLCQIEIVHEVTMKTEMERLQRSQLDPVTCYLN